MIATPAATNDSAWTTIETTSGLALRVRPEQPGDGPTLVDLFSHLSPSSRFLRFSKVMDDPDPQRAQQDGLERLTATFRSENRGIWALLKRSPFPVSYEVDGPEISAVVDLTGPRVQ